MSILNPHSSTPSLTGKNRAEAVSQSHEGCCCCFSARAFTLIELMAVVLVILLLAAISLGVVGYVQRRMAIQTTRAQLAAMEAGLEAYKSDWGYYPRTNPERISCDGAKEAANNYLLYQALSGTCSGCTKRYLSFSIQQIRTNSITKLPTICDTWGTPFNYYNSPSTIYTVSNAYPANLTNVYWYGGYSLGGQVNGSGFDLFSYGPDQYTYVPNAIAYQFPYNYAWFAGNNGGGYTNPLSALDDIANWK